MHSEINPEKTYQKASEFKKNSERKYDNNDLSIFLQWENLMLHQCHKCVDFSCNHAVGFWSISMNHDDDGSYISHRDKTIKEYQYDPEEFEKKYYIPAKKRYEKKHGIIRIN